MNNLTPRALMALRLHSRSFPSPEALIIGHALAERATVTDPDGLTGFCDAALQPLMTRTNLSRQAVQDGIMHLEHARYLIYTDDEPLDCRAIRYAIDVRALPPCPVPIDAEFPTQLESPVFWWKGEAA